MSLILHAILEQSEVNGPGRRLVLWTQGCSKACPGCFNPETWKFEGGREWSSSDLVDHILSRAPEGLTLTGGDPLEQSAGLLDFLRELHSRHPSLEGILPRGIILFSGYTLAEIALLPEASECLSFIDLLIDGRYIQSLRYSHGLAGSSNQTFHFSSLPSRGTMRILPSEIAIDQSVEIHPSGSDHFELTGFPSIDRQFLKRLGIRIIS